MSRSPARKDLGASGRFQYVYVTDRLALPDAVGYEKAWDWQLFFFGLVRLPILVVLLLVVLWIESRVLSEGQ